MSGPSSDERTTSGHGGRDGSEFAREAESSQPGILREFGEFLLHNKKWWLAPIVIILLLFGLLIVFGGTSAAPFIYTLF
ncbi:MAG TPA: DUF5989 family protein [Candidatus Polarisedimenticolaceae bacterium]|nr:DUF5989 family protein [Candidatus Polarisedimenticolaceae bacterium]